jgi:hypothetical protein
MRDERAVVAVDLRQRPEAVVFQLKQPVRMVEGVSDPDEGHRSKRRRHPASLSVRLAGRRVQRAHGRGRRPSREEFRSRSLTAEPCVNATALPITDLLSRIIPAVCRDSAVCVGSIRPLNPEEHAYAHGPLQSHSSCRATNSDLVSCLLCQRSLGARCGGTRWTAWDRVHGQGRRHPGPALSRDHRHQEHQPAVARAVAPGRPAGT